MEFILTSSKYVAYANQLNLIEGYAIAAEEEKSLPSLWMAGGVHDRLYFKNVKNLILKNGLEERVRIMGLLTHAELTELYKKADIFVFPSTLEACPQTLIEAMACGLPMTVSNVGPMPEICRDAAIYFDPFDKRDIADKILQLYADAGLRERLRKVSLERCKAFNWENTAKETVKIFEEVIKL